MFFFGSTKFVLIGAGFASAAFFHIEAQEYRAQNTNSGLPYPKEALETVSTHDFTGSIIILSG